MPAIDNAITGREYSCIVETSPQRSEFNDANCMGAAPGIYMKKAHVLRLAILGN